MRCLQGLRGEGVAVVYVDSGSTDGSAARARGLGAALVELDMSLPFTAARARNSGFRALIELWPECTLVQFVDGDCELLPGWLGVASGALRADSNIAAVCGHLAERHPEATIYNRLCQMEWEGPSGPINSCGGVAMFEARAFIEAGQFREEMIAGEEPELCARLRARGKRIVRLDATMALHDANMTTLTQWLKRARRGGHAFAECFWLSRPSGFRRREVTRAMAWGCLIPLGTLALVLVSMWYPLAFAGVGVVLAGYVCIPARVAWQRWRAGASAGDSLLYGAFCTLSKGPEAIGVLQFGLNRWRNARTGLIEHRR